MSQPVRQQESFIGVYILAFMMLVIVVLLITGCNNLPRLMAPTTVGSSGTTGISGWSPYIVVHTPGEALGAYQQSMPALIARGNLRGVRISISKGDGVNFVNKALLGMGLDGLGLIDNNYLFDGNIEHGVDEAVRAYPEIKVFQVGNEITTILPKGGPQMTIEQYMVIFDRIYKYVDKNYPQIKIMNQSTFGSGQYGSNELERMAELGLNNYSPERVIIGINCYGLQSTVLYAHVLDHYFDHFERWVTETGIDDANGQVDYVKNNYPLIQNYLGATRVYWYTYFDGDGPSDSNYSLIKNIRDPNHLWKSPLYQALAGEAQ